MSKFIGSHGDSYVCNQESTEGAPRRVRAEGAVFLELAGHRELQSLHPENDVVSVVLKVMTSFRH